MAHLQLHNELAEMNNDSLIIDVALVRDLVATQFPQWKDLPVRPVAASGWDNRTFHLGDGMLVRMPSAAHYAAQVEKEQQLLPKLAPLLPLRVPVPLAMGKQTKDYPWKWSIYNWLSGDTAASGYIADMGDFAITLAQFLVALQRIDPVGGPVAGPHNFYRGGLLSTYDAETRQAIVTLKDKIDVAAVTEIWKAALATSWQGAPVWVHGDVSVGNLLVQEGQLTAVIDFGLLAIGDPACDLAIAWTLFEGKSREVFRARLSLDSGTWARGRAWTLWKALITIVGKAEESNAETMKCWCIIDEVLVDHKRSV